MATVTGTKFRDFLDVDDGVTDEADVIFADAGDDMIPGLGAVGANPITGTAGDDQLLGSAGDDQIFGLGGDDVIIGGLGADRINGGAGIDTARYEDSSVGVTASLAGGLCIGGTAEGDELVNSENITGSSHDDALIGADGANVLNGDGGDDGLLGGEGPDTLIGGAGWDTAYYYDSQSGVSVSLRTGFGSGGTAQG